MPYAVDSSDLCAALSQMKWLWFRRPHSLRHLEFFDAAARGPGGSLFLLFRLRRMSETLEPIISPRLTSSQ